jgi:hypothetical protein
LHRFFAKRLYVFGKTFGCASYGENVHSVRSKVKHTAHACRAELQGTEKHFFFLFFVESAKASFFVLRKLVALKPLLEIFLVIHIESSYFDEQIIPLLWRPCQR